MTLRIGKSDLRDRLSGILQGISDSEISTRDREIAVEDAVMQLNQDLPRRIVREFAGNDTRYYLLYGKAVEVDESNHDAQVALTDSDAGADEQLAIEFTLDTDDEIHGIRLYLRRIGATIDGELMVSVYSDDTNLPSIEIRKSLLVDIDGGSGAPAGAFAWVEFAFKEPLSLKAGTYHAVLSAQGYDYVSPTAEVELGVDQSAVTDSKLSTLNSTTWTAYGTNSNPMIEVIAGLENWRTETGSILKLEYPAAVIADDDNPQVLEPQDYEVFRTEAGVYLRFKNHQPSSTETVRMEFAQPYFWNDDQDPRIDVPQRLVPPLCQLAAAFACDMLAVRYGQTRDSSIQADSVDRGTQSEQYRAQARKYFENYLRMTGQPVPGRGGSATAGTGEKPAAAVADIDKMAPRKRDYLFHPRRDR